MFFVFKKLSVSESRNGRVFKIAGITGNETDGFGYKTRLSHIGGEL